MRKAGGGATPPAGREFENQISNNNSTWIFAQIPGLRQDILALDPKFFQRLGGRLPVGGRYRCRAYRSSRWPMNRPPSVGVDGIGGGGGGSVTFPRRPRGRPTATTNERYDRELAAFADAILKINSNTRFSDIEPGLVLHPRGARTREGRLQCGSEPHKRLSQDRSIADRHLRRRCVQASGLL